MGERVGIVGSRDYPDLDLVRSYVLHELADDDVVISGGARGVDTVAEQAARERGLEVIIFKPDRERWGARAYAMRNREVVEASDRLVAFWDGRSPGTLMTLRMAKQAGKPCKVRGETRQGELFEEV